MNPASSKVPVTSVRITVRNGALLISLHGAISPSIRWFTFCRDAAAHSLFAIVSFVSVVKEQGRTHALGPFVLFGDPGDTVVFLDQKTKGAGRSYV